MATAKQPEPRILEFKLRRTCAYGRYIYYPVNHVAEVIVALMGRATFTQAEVEILESIGVKMDIEIVSYIKKKRNWQKREKSNG